MRLCRQSETAAQLVQYLNGSLCINDLPPRPPPYIKQIFHASLPGHLGHAVASKQMPGGHSSVLALEVCLIVDKFNCEYYFQRYS
jgi:cystathionine beta-lyase/cystathionine gamma-synthase